MTKICYACSGGGHLNQLLQIVTKIKANDIFFITIDREDSHSKLEEYRKYFVRDTDKRILFSVINAYESFKIIKKEKPDFVITNGGGSALFPTYFAKLFGTKVIFIESFARIKEPSLFGKMVYPIADLTLIQWKELKNYYKKAVYGGPVFDFKIKKNKKKNKIFLTVGTSNKQFNRLVKAVDNLETKYEIFGQIGTSSYVPKFKHKRFLKDFEMQRRYTESKIVICHAGTASIENAITNGCKVIAMSRLQRYGEHVDDHQLDILQKFTKIGAITAVHTEEELKNSIKNPENNKKVNIRSRIVSIINEYVE
jgi:UDP-N-acetylglucosamine transferase subunit ALG13